MVRRGFFSVKDSGAAILVPIVKPCPEDPLVRGPPPGWRGPNGRGRVWSSTAPRLTPVSKPPDLPWHLGSPRVPLPGSVALRQGLRAV